MAWVPTQEEIRNLGFHPRTILDQLLINGDRRALRRNKFDFFKRMQKKRIIGFIEKIKLMANGRETIIWFGSGGDGPSRQSVKTPRKRFLKEVQKHFTYVKPNGDEFYTSAKTNCVRHSDRATSQPPETSWRLQEEARALKTFHQSEQLNEFNSLFYTMTNASNEDSFIRSYEALQNFVGVSNSLLVYFNKTWLPFKSRFVKYEVNQTVNLGVRTTSRVESLHKSLKDHLIYSTGGLSDVFSKLKIVFTEQNRLHETEVSSEYLRAYQFSEHHIFRDLNQKISGYIMNKLLKILDEVNTDEENRTYDDQTLLAHGLPTYPTISNAKINREPLTMESVHVHWHLFPLMEELEPGNVEVAENPEQQNVEEQSQQQSEYDVVLNELHMLSETSKVMILPKLKELLDIGLKGPQPPVVATKRTRGRPPGSKNKQIRQRRDPSLFEHVRETVISSQQ
ncbi:hypothetical protein P9112_012063 [Eukaryota sp. TZLM1-RC]